MLDAGCIAPAIGLLLTRFHWIILTLTIVVVPSVMLLDGVWRHAVVIAAVSTLALLIALGVPLIRMQLFCPAILRGTTAQRAIALTFDDGPDPEETPALLDLLRRENVKATFFLIGRRVDEHPELARRIADEGHLVGNHSHNHRWQNTLTSPSAIAREMTDAQGAIERATGVVPRFYRPPIGLTTPNFQTAIRRVGLKLVGWEVRPFDTQYPADEVVKRVLRGVKPGSIVLLHDGFSPPGKIVEITATLIRELRTRGFELVRVDDMT